MQSLHVALPTVNCNRLYREPAPTNCGAPHGVTITHSLWALVHAVLAVQVHYSAKNLKLFYECLIAFMRFGDLSSVDCSRTTPGFQD